jgi:hypothetical protein
MLERLPGVPREAHQQVLGLVAHIREPVTVATRAFPVVVPQRVLPVCLTCAAMWPQGEPSAVADLATLCAFIYAMDDIADGVGERYGDEQVELLLEAAARAGEQPGQVLGEPLRVLAQAEPSGRCAQALEGLALAVQRLRAYPAAERYSSLFARHLRLLMEGMRMELRWSRAFQAEGTLPTYEEYLREARESIATPTALAALLLVLAPEQGSAAWSEPLQAVARACGSSVRLVNDACGFQREEQEGKPNSVSILMSEQCLGTQQARELALQQSESWLHTLEQLAAQLPQALQPWGAAAVRLTHFCRDMSLAREFRELSSQSLPG